MRTLYIDCGMGAAGDMLAAALLELLPDPDGFVEEFNSLGLPGIRMEREESVKCGITGTHVSILVDGAEEGEGHHHHDGEHHHHHHHGIGDIEHIVMHHLDLKPAVREDILAVFGLIAEAESHVHGMPVADIHFHEVGTMDAIADVAAVSMLMDRIHPDEVVVSPIRTGYGHERCAHGILPVPAPATAYILSGLPIYSGDIEGELCTPTGAALLRHFATRFGQMPLMNVSAIGYGMGRKDFPAANCVRAMLGGQEGSGDTVIGLSCNVDDMTGEEIGFAIERLLSCGAKDAYTLPIGMKKNRPGVMLSVICAEHDLDEMVRMIFRYTTTIGIRKTVYERYVLTRRQEGVDTGCGPVRMKISQGYGVERVKPEYDDLERIAKERGISIREAADAVLSGQGAYGRHIHLR